MSAKDKQVDIDACVQFLISAARAYVESGQLDWTDATCALADAMMLAVAQGAANVSAVRAIHQKLVDYTETTIAETERAVVVRLNRLN